MKIFQMFKDSNQHEWDISGLYINANQFNMIRFRDHNIREIWRSNFVDEGTSNGVMNFI